MPKKRTTGVIAVERALGGWRDYFRSYEVMLNGERRADLWRGEKTRIEVDPGAVEIFIQIDWCKSRLLQVNVEAGSEERLVCSPRSLWTTIYGITFGRNDYVRLEHF